MNLKSDPCRRCSSPSSAAGSALAADAIPVPGRRARPTPVTYTFTATPRPERSMAYFMGSWRIGYDETC